MKTRRPHLIASCFLLIVGFAASASSEIRFENKQRSTVGFLDGAGRIQDASRVTVGYISDGRVEDSGRSTIGYINDDGRIENARRVTIGYVSSDGRVENASRSTIGYINPDGRIEDSNRSTIGYTTDYDSSMIKEVACFWFFFFAP